MNERLAPLATLKLTIGSWFKKTEPSKVTPAQEGASLLILRLDRMVDSNYITRGTLVDFAEAERRQKVIDAFLADLVGVPTDVKQALLGQLVETAESLQAKFRRHQFREEERARLQMYSRVIVFIKKSV